MRVKYHMKVILLGFGCLVASAVNIGAVQNNTYFFTIQIASFQQRQLAMDAAEKLKAANQDAFFRSKQVDSKGTWYRLYLSRYASIQAARAGRDKMRQQGIISVAYIRRVTYLTSDDDHLAQKVNAALPVQTDSKFRGANPISKQQTQLTREAAKQMVRSKDEPRGITVKNVTYRIGEKQTDAALIHADGYFWPSVHLSRQRDGSRLVVSVDKVSHVEGGISTSETNGKYIKKGTTQYDPDKDRIILDLELPASESYTLTQFFNEAENVFTLVLSKE